MELTKEHFDEVTGQLATKDYVESKIDEVLPHLNDSMAAIEEGLGPEERIVLIDEKLNQDICISKCDA